MDWGIKMDYFEKKLVLELLEQNIEALDIGSSRFEEFFEAFEKEFKVSKKKIRPYLKDDELDLDTISSKIKFREIVLENIKKLKPCYSLLKEQFGYIKEIFKLNDDEEKMFVLLAMKEISRLIEVFLYSIEVYRKRTSILEVLNLKYDEGVNIGESLYYKGLLDEAGRNADVPKFWQKILNCKKYNSMDKIMAKIMGEKLEPDLALNDYKYIEKSAETAIDILKASVKEKRKGVNILLYGAVGTGKTEFAKVLANCSDVSMYSVITNKNKFEEADRSDRLKDLCSKQYVLDNSSNSCILFDEAQDVLNTGFSFFYRAASKGHLNHVLETTPVPIIWTTNNIEDVDSAFLRRMTYTIEFEALSNEARLNIWNKALKKNEFKVKKSKVEELSKNYNVSPSIISNAVKTTKMINGDVDKFEELIENVATVVQKKKNVKNLNGFNSERYDIGLVNADLDMNNLTDRIIQSGKLNFSLCLYGEPGTGKSEYAKYLADKLGLEVIYKKASDLISMWLGQTEQNIANAFNEAKNKKAMLIFDEADSFLQNRSNAQRSWEVTQVNEMLTWMESHQYPFICTTNLINSLDEASLRRFTFKVKFDFMTQSQVNRAIEKFFNIKSANLMLNGLTTGDFAVVKKKVDFLGITSLDEIEKMLNDEVKVKKSPNLKSSVGF